MMTNIVLTEIQCFSIDRVILANESFNHMLRNLTKYLLSFAYCLLHSSINKYLNNNTITLIVTTQAGATVVKEFFLTQSH